MSTTARKNESAEAPAAPVRMPRRFGVASYEAALKGLRSAARAERPEDAFVEQLECVLEELPRLASHRWEILAVMRSILDEQHRVQNLAGDPARVIADLAEDAMIRAGARRRVLDEPMLDARALATALGSRSVNPSEFAAAKRRKGEVLGLPVGNRFLIPAFQVDLERRMVRPGVREVNMVLGADGDPWGVASWWVSGNGRLAGKSPADVVRDASRAPDVVRAARAVTAPVG